MLESIAVFTSAWGVILAARKKLLSCPVSFIASLCYFWIFWQQKLYADMVLQVIFLVGIIYGWILWGRDRHEDHTLRENAFKKEIKIAYIDKITLLKQMILAIFLNGFVYYALAHWSHDSAPFWDATLTSWSILAQYWEARRYRESWLLWSIIDIFYTALYYERALYLTMILYSSFVVIALYGYYQWRSRSVCVERGV